MNNAFANVSVVTPPPQLGDRIFQSGSIFLTMIDCVAVHVDFKIMSSSSLPTCMLYVELTYHFCNIRLLSLSYKALLCIDKSLFAVFRI